MTITDGNIKKISKIFATKDELRLGLDKLKDEIHDDVEKQLVSHRSDLIDKLDVILKEILASREEQTILSHRSSDHENRISKIETKLNVN